MEYINYTWVVTCRNGPSKILLHAIMTLVSRVTKAIMACDKILLGLFLHLATHMWIGLVEQKGGMLRWSRGGTQWWRREVEWLGGAACQCKLVAGVAKVGTNMTSFSAAISGNIYVRGFTGRRATWNTPVAVEEQTSMPAVLVQQRCCSNAKAVAAIEWSTV